MEKLFDDTLLVSKKRPTTITAQQSEKLFEELAEEVLVNEYSDDEVDLIKEDLKELSLNQSGFEIAKDLDSQGRADYDFEGDFIDWLGNMSSRRDEIVRENVKLWAKAHNPQPKFRKGDELVVTDTIAYMIKPNLILYVYDIRMDEGIYIMAKDKEQQGGYLLEFERVEDNCKLNIE
jgi:hypothetical protein